MTLIIALRGSDGIVLATDTTVSERVSKGISGEDQYPEIDITLHSRKLLQGKLHGLAAGCAGHSAIGFDVARRILKDLEELDYVPDDLNDTLVRIGNEVYERKFPARDTQQRENSECPDIATVIVVNPLTRFCPLWKLAVNRESHAMPSDTKHFAGRQAISPVFFAERYYDKHDEFKIDDLVFLAAHVICTAGRMTDGIGGLEIMTIRQDKTNFLEANVVEKLQKRSELLDEKLKKELFSLF
jgi:hypothetical protein